MYNIVTGFGNYVDNTVRQDGLLGEGEFAFDPMTLFSDPSSAIVEADNILGFQLAPSAVLPVAALAYFLLFREPILGFVDGIISK